MKSPLPHSHWRHYKSSGGEDYTYEVVDIAEHSETGEAMVVYRALYGEWHLYTRPLSMWFDIIEWQGQRVQRFTEI